jgi:hypothetical protein
VREIHQTHQLSLRNPFQLEQAIHELFWLKNEHKFSTDLIMVVVLPLVRLFGSFFSSLLPLIIILLTAVWTATS